MLLGPTGWRTISQHDIDTFAELTGDRQLINVNPARAAAGPFGSTIAHG
jgi:acyl dehydratase